MRAQGRDMTLHAYSHRLPGVRTTMFRGINFRNNKSLVQQCIKVSIISTNKYSNSVFVFVQDYDSNMFRLQPTHTVSSSWVGLGWRQRLGRAYTIYLRRIYSKTKAGQSKGLGSTSVLPIAAGARRRKSTQRYVTYSGCRPLEHI